MADCPSSYNAARGIYKSKRDGYRTISNIKQRAESNTNGFNMTSEQYFNNTTYGEPVF